MIARVRGPMRAATAARSMLRVIGSQSTKTGVAPCLTIMFGTAKKLCAQVITLVAAADAAELQCDLHRGRRRRDDANRTTATECGERRLESLDPSAARDVSRAQHVGGCGHGRFVEQRTRELQGMCHFSCAPRARRR
jgi:hypothetical protein